MNNAHNLDNMPKVKRESKNKIRVEFERTPLKERLKAKFLSLFFLKKVVWFVFRLVLLVGIAYVVLNPFLQKIAESFMSHDDFVDNTVQWIPRHFTFDTYKAILLENGYFKAFFCPPSVRFSCNAGRTSSAPDPATDCNRDRCGR